MNLRLRFSFYIVYLFTFSTNSTHSFKFSIFSFWRQVSVLFKTVPSMTMRFFKIYCRRAITKSSCVFCNCYHPQMVWVPAINFFTDVVYHFTVLKFFVNNHRKLMSASVASLITNPTVARFVSCAFPQPARICNMGFLFKLIQIKNVISWRFKNTFHLSPNIGI